MNFSLVWNSSKPLKQYYKMYLKKDWMKKIQIQIFHSSSWTLYIPVQMFYYNKSAFQIVSFKFNKIKSYAQSVPVCSKSLFFFLYKINETYIWISNFYFTTWYYEISGDTFYLTIKCFSSFSFVFNLTIWTALISDKKLFACMEMIRVNNKNYQWFCVSFIVYEIFYICNSKRDFSFLTVQLVFVCYNEIQAKS